MATDDPDDLTVVRTKSARRRLARLRASPTYGESPAATRARRTALVKRLAIEAGFSRVGIARAEPLDADRAALDAWIAAGMHGAMAWMVDDTRRRCDPRQLVSGARAVVVVALDYDSAAPKSTDLDLGGQGRAWVSRYAWGDDYHLVAEARLKRWTAAVVAALRGEVGGDFRLDGCAPGPLRGGRDFRWSVDHGPVIERAWAERAGLGWRGKHSLLVDPRRGSYFFLATAITTLDLDPDPPEVDHCGSCTACIDACPTAAIVAPRVVDARRCTSHATIEADGAPDATTAALFGDHLFGCDRCQEVCPFNRFSRPGDPAFAPRPEWLAPRLTDVLAMEGDAALARSALKRRGLAGLHDTARAIGARRRGGAAGSPMPVEPPG